MSNSAFDVGQGNSIVLIVQGSLTGICVLNLILSLILAVSLRAMWSLMHFCQVVVFFALVIRMPAQSQMTSDLLQGVITLQFIPVG